MTRNQHLENTHADLAHVSVLGLGLMGRALAEAFLTAGHPVTVWNRTASKADDLRDRGAVLAATPGEAVAAGELVVLCVTDETAVRDVLSSAGSRINERVLVNLTSSTSVGARETAQWASNHGAAYLDGAILGAPQGIGTEEGAILYSGDRSAFDNHEQTLVALGGASTYLGEDPGLASLNDVAVLSMMWGMLNSYLHSAALLGESGVNAAEFTPVVKGAIQTVSDWLEKFADQIDSGEHPADDASIDTHLASMHHLTEESEIAGVNTDLPRSFQEIAARAVAEGRGQDGYTAIIEIFRKPV